MTNAPYEPGAPSPDERREELLTAYLLGELDPQAHAKVEADLAIDDAFAARRDELAGALTFVKDAFPAEKLSDSAVATILDEARLRAGEARGWSVVPPSVVRAAAGLALLMGGAFVAKGVLGTNTYDVAPEAGVARLSASEAVADALPEEEPVVLADADAKRLLDLGYAGKGVQLGRRAGEVAPDGSAEGGWAFEAGLAGERQREEALRADAEAAQLAKLKEELAARGLPTDQGEARIGYVAQTPAANEPAVDGFVAGARLQTLERAAKDVTSSYGGAYKGPGDSTPPAVGGGGATTLSVKPEQPFVGAVTVNPTPPASPVLKSVAPVGGPGAAGPAGPSSPGPVAPSERARGAKRELARNATPARKKSKVAPGADPAPRPTEPGTTDFYLAPGNEPQPDARRALRLELGEEAEFLDEVTLEAPALTPAQFDATVAGYLERCRILPDESANDMYFRFWGDHPFVRTAEDALSTFAADADTSSYALARRFLADRTLPPRESVRTEEFVNYFKPDVPAPLGDTFGVQFDLAPNAFSTDPNSWMLRVAVRGKDMAAFERRPLALTFVLDVSGSMEKQGRLGLVKEALRLLATELSMSDSVALVAFNNEAKTLLPMVSAGNRGALEDSFGPLTPGGGTNVEAGLTQGYELASAGLVPGAVNRVVFLSDGVGNIGETDQERILDKVAAMRERGIYLNTIGVGMGNHDDEFLEQLANKGDGVANYIDSKHEAERVMVYEFTETFQPIARDVKIQVEFDPTQVLEWRQLGYENRAIADADFRNDAVDAGELNAGHQVSALYEIVRTPGSSPTPLATCRVRWKEPFAVDRGDTSRSGAEFAETASEREWRTTGAEAVYDVAGASWGFRRALVAAQLAESLRRSRHARSDDLGRLEELAAALVSQRPDDLELAQLRNMVAIARPLLEAERQRVTPLDAALDELAERTYYEARLEQLVEAGDLADRSAEVRSEIEALEAKVRELVAKQVGYDFSDDVAPVPPSDPAKIRRR